MLLLLQRPLKTNNQRSVRDWLWGNVHRIYLNKKMNLYDKFEMNNNLSKSNNLQQFIDTV